MNDPQRWDPRAVPVAFITDAHTGRRELDGILSSAAAVAVDTETVILRDADGNIVKRDLDVDGPGPWRVMSIAARFDTAAGPQYRAWVLDMASINASALQSAFTGVTPWGWNANFDRAVLGRGGLQVRNWRDAMLFEAVLRQGAISGADDHVWYSSLERAVQRFLGLKGIEGKSDVRLNYDETTPLTPEEQRYAADDAITTLFVGEILERQAVEQGLIEVCNRTCRAQAFVHSMKVNGLPFDASTYQKVIDRHKDAANAAAEKVAVLTTGQHVLRTLVGWAKATGILPEAELNDETLVEVGLPLLHDPAVFDRFLQALREQRTQLTAKMAAALGVGEPVDDLFAEGVHYNLPFDPDDETKIRRWLSKAAPQFVAEFLAAAGSTTRGLTKANDLMEVYAGLQVERSDVPVELRQVAVHLEAHARYSKILEQYAGSQGAATLVPDWNLGSQDQVKDNLNRFAEAGVQAYMASTVGAARLLEKADSVDNKALKLIGGPLTVALLNWREHDKMVSTYGDELVKLVHPRTGRVHASYTQELTGTGRLASYKPNAQNLSPQAKPHITLARRQPDGRLVSRVEGQMRVLVCADLSQAELRFLAHMAQDENMLAAFRSGEDLHTRTATLMFGVDLKALKADGDKTVRELAATIAGLERYVAADPDQLGKVLYKALRGKAKAVSFGYAYGLKGASLAQQLTVQGVPTTKEEADELLALFDRAYPQVAAWMAARVKFINDLSASLKDLATPSGVDFEASWKLHKLYYRASQTQKALGSKLGYTPTPREIAEALVSHEELTARLASGEPAQDSGPAWDAKVEQVRTQQTEQVAWALGHFGSAILNDDGTPWSFESRNLAGRRRLFQISTADWTLAMASIVSRSRKPFAKKLTNEWVDAYNGERTAAWEAACAAAQEAGRVAPRKPALLALTKVDPRTKRETVLTEAELKKVLDTKELRISFVQFVLNAYDQLPNPAAARDMLFRHAMADRVRALGNQYRNHPIQSGVADAVLDAFGGIWDEIGEKFPTANPIQSVHDSIVLECDLQEARAVRELVVRHMEGSLSAMCPTVPCVADGDVQLSLYDDTIIPDAELDELVERYALAA